MGYSNLDDYDFITTQKQKIRIKVIDFATEKLDLTFNEDKFYLIVVANTNSKLSNKQVIEYSMKFKLVHVEEVGKSSYLMLK